MYTDIACGPAPSICARGARNAAPRSIQHPARAGVRRGSGERHAFARQSNHHATEPFERELDEGEAYATNSTAHHLWRWIGMHAPDLVAVVGPDEGLVDALARSAPAETGTMPARRVEARPGFLDALLRGLDAEKPA